MKHRMRLLTKPEPMLDEPMGEPLAYTAVPAHIDHKNNTIKFEGEQPIPFADLRHLIEIGQQCTCIRCGWAHFRNKPGEAPGECFKCGAPPSYMRPSREGDARRGVTIQGIAWDEK